MQHERQSQFDVRYALVARCAIRVFAVLALWAPWATAQSTSLLNGSVSDPSGASVAGAKITLTDAATGLQRTTKATRQDSTSSWMCLRATIGWRQRRGFRPIWRRTSSSLSKRPPPSTLSFRLRGIQTMVTVEGEAPLINRTDASLGNTVEENQIAQLPIADRNVVQLLSLQPGVAYLGKQVECSTDTRSGAVNGMRSDQSNVTLDGIGVNDQNNGYAFTSVLNMPPDSVQEFRVTTANANADSGYSSGAQVALVTKSGTNNFHGSATSTTAIPSSAPTIHS